jgi:uncharacterized protein (DUF302 family)
VNNPHPGVDNDDPKTIPGMSVRRSTYPPRGTTDRLVAAVTARGMTVFARIDHGAAANDAGLPLRPTELVVFGNARAGTTLMQEAQTAGIDLPLKVLVWTDAAGRTWLGYNDPNWIAVRHDVAAGVASALRAMGDMLAAVASEATGTTDAPRNPATS